MKICGDWRASLTEKLTKEQLQKFTQEEAIAAISPKRTYTDAEHERAFWRYVVNDLRTEWLEDLFFTVTHGEFKRDENGHWITNEYVPVDMKYMEDFLRKLLYNGDYSKGYDDPYDYLGTWAINRTVYPNEEEHRAHMRRESEGGTHCGDCTAFPASCTRCMIDEFYGVDTKCWTGKAPTLFYKAYPRDAPA